MPPITDNVLGALFLANATAGMLAVEPHEPWSYGRADATPIPEDIGPTCLVDVPTGQELVGPVQDLVHTSTALQRSLAVLPIDDEHERLVEGFVQAHAPARTARDLTRRRSRAEFDVG